MKDDLKKYINLAHNLDNLILKSLDYGNKEKLYESFINGQLFFEQVVATEPDDKTELTGLITSGITDTGVNAPYIDTPYIAIGDITYNERTSSVFAKNEKLRRPWGDPWIYYSATTGNLYAYKCGRKSQSEITPCPTIKVGEWKNANAFKDAIMSKIFTNIANTAPNTEETVTSTGDIPYLKKMCRNSFYNTYAFFIAKKNFGEITKWPISPAYKTTIKITNGFGTSTPTYDFDLVGKIVPPDFDPLDEGTIEKSIKNFVRKRITYNSKTYVFKKSENSMLFEASTIFDSDSTGYVGDEIVKNIIKVMDYRIVEKK